MGGRRRKVRDHPPLSSLHVELDDGIPSLGGVSQESSTATAGSSGNILVTEERIRAHLHDFYDDLNSNKHHRNPEMWRALYEKYHSQQYVIIRPSGNPLASEGFVQMHCSEDVEVISMILVSIDSIQFMAGGVAAVATYTVDQKFKYKGTLHEDRCVVSCILEQSDGDVKICHEHRTTGQPIPKQTRWSAD